MVELVIYTLGSVWCRFTRTPHQSAQIHTNNQIDSFARSICARINWSGGCCSFIRNGCRYRLLKQTDIPTSHSDTCVFGVSRKPEEMPAHFRTSNAVADDACPHVCVASLAWRCNNWIPSIWSRVFVYLCVSCVCVYCSNVYLCISFWPRLCLDSGCVSSVCLCRTEASTIFSVQYGV